MKNKTTPSFFFLFLFLSILFLSSNQVAAQDYDIYELQKENPSVSKSAGKVDKSKNRTEFYDLYQNLHTTIYVSNNKIDKVYGEGDIKRITLSDNNSFAFLNTDNDQFKEVKLITVKLKSKNDLNQVLDLSDSPHFVKLKYVFLKCYFEYTDEDIQNFIKVTPNVRVFHISANPS
ncbi:hypothetical protein [Tamlana crocina]|uniref:Uncharacterized protein n=1 Tax=Tamlana crocina TaxID=393006 RepID=A0ABX1DDM1_9FLAO|nr:hypothetical protein [Tamlana crocina]NJX15442.1 hypothetical protein [Tamlana crocina]